MPDSHKPPPGVVEIKTLDDLVKGPPTVQCPTCQVINSASAKICAWCNGPLPKPFEEK